ncbi:MAG: low molecular weight phosphotyrosine protein phosphatase [Prevotella sp.]|nr:low molecular weight phosphotyrosine protein phosphatase [Prevotella sp.]
MTKKGKIRILFICLGNICRSPAAHGVMQHLVDENGLTSQFEIDSAGVGNWHVGQLPDARMRQHGRARGYIFNHHARQFDAATDFQRFDYIVTMDEENYHNITSMAHTESERAQVIRMSQYLKAHPGATSVPDPYYGGDADFKLALDLIEDGCSNLLNALTCTNSIS